jgi:hypothetical protein
MAKSNSHQSLILDQQPIKDLLNLIDSGSEFLILASEHVPDRQELNQVVYGICAALRAVGKSVRKSGVPEALILDSRHPAFRMASTSIRLSRELEDQASAQEVDKDIL